MFDDIKKILWATADKLRANMNATEYKHLVLGLIFLKYISDTLAHSYLLVNWRAGRLGLYYRFGRQVAQLDAGYRPRQQGV